MKTLLKQLLIVGIAILTTSLTYANNGEPISGELQYLQAENGEVFLAINSSKDISSKNDEGGMQTSKLLQLVIPDPEMGKKAMGLIGQRVTSEGEPMAAHTQHHHTPVLWVVDQLETTNGQPETVNPERGQPQAEGEQNKSQNPRDNRSSHSVEW